MTQVLYNFAFIYQVTQLKQANLELKLQMAEQAAAKAQASAPVRSVTPIGLNFEAVQNLVELMVDAMQGYEAGVNTLHLCRMNLGGCGKALE